MSQIWFITGASRGLGRAIALAALKAGHSVMAATRNGSFDAGNLDIGERLHVVKLDVSSNNFGDYQSAIEVAVNRFGRIDILVNNAGYGLLSLFEETEEEQLRAAFETNVFGLMRVTRAVLPHMREQHSGHIFFISSLAGYVGGASMYSTTKFAVTGFAESLAFELQSFGIKITNVAPGYFRTDFLDATSVSSQPSGSIAAYDGLRGQMDAFVQQANHNQMGDPDKLGHLLVKIATTEHPPLHLAVGEDAISALEQKHASLLNDVNTWREDSVSTHFDNV